MTVSNETSVRAPQKILAVASGGGHWVQLLRLRPAFEGHQVTYVTVDASYAADLAGERLLVVNDATRWNKLALVLLALRTFAIILRVRPDLVISTGAAPGYLAVRFGKLFGARTIWLDSIANVERLSMSGDLAAKHADLWLTQWEHLSSADGPDFRGAVL